MEVTIVSGPKAAQRSEKLKLSPNATLDELRKLYKPALNIHRKAFKLANASAAGKEGAAAVALDARHTLAEQGVKNGSEILFKDLGPQIGYRTVFLVEYAGPLAFMLFYAMRPSLVYGGGKLRPYNYTQKLYLALFLAHFVKRELESIFVHKFSHPTMPLRNIFKNCIYYWSFAAFIGYVLCSPAYREPSRLQANIGAICMVVSEILNGLVHLQLSGMRTQDGDQTRRVPQGPLFALVTCPNYFFEFLSWVSFSVGTNILSSWMFTAAGLLQMANWALKKHRNYIKSDPSIKKTKKSILPFLL